MLLPAQYAWFEPVLIATIVVFIIDLVRQRVDVSDDDAEYNCPCSDAAAVRRKNLAVSVGMG